MPDQSLNPLEKLYRVLSDSVGGGSAMREYITYADLTRAQQRLLTRLYGGGTLRGQDDEVILTLSLRGLISGEILTELGREVCLEALPQLRLGLMDKHRRIFPVSSNI